MIIKKSLPAEKNYCLSTKESGLVDNRIYYAVVNVDEIPKLFNSNAQIKDGIRQIMSAIQNDVENLDYNQTSNYFAESQSIGCSAASFKAIDLLSGFEIIGTKGKEYSFLKAVCMLDILLLAKVVDHYPVGKPCSECDNNVQCDYVHSNLCAYSGRVATQIL